MVALPYRDQLLRVRFVRAVVHLLDNLDEHHAPVAASAMAFDAFLSLVPLLAFAGYMLQNFDERGDLVFGPILQSAPAPVAQLLDAEFFRLSDGSLLAPVSVAAFLWVSSGGISTAMGVFEAMYHSEERPWWRRRLIAMGSVVGGVAVLIGVAVLAYFLVSASGSFGARILAFALPPLVLVGMLSAFCRIAIKRPRPQRRRIMPGVLATIVLWSGASALFSIYVATLARYVTLYGSLAAVAIFLFWLWLLALALLVGGEINAQLEGVREPATEPTAVILPVSDPSA